MFEVTIMAQIRPQKGGEICNTGPFIATLRFGKASNRDHINVIADCFVNTEQFLLWFNICLMTKIACLGRRPNTYVPFKVFLTRA